MLVEFVEFNNTKIKGRLDIYKITLDHLPMVSFKPSLPSIITASLFSSILASILLIVPGFLCVFCSVWILFFTCPDPLPILLLFGVIWSAFSSDKVWWRVKQEQYVWKYQIIDILRKEGIKVNVNFYADTLTVWFETSKLLASITIVDDDLMFEEFCSFFGSSLKAEIGSTRVLFPFSSSLVFL